MSIIDDKYAALRTAGLDLGPPITPEIGLADGGTYRDYAHVHGTASIYYHARVAAAYEVHGAIWGLWASLGRQTSSFGYPTSDELDAPHSIPGHPSRVSHFEHGSIYWDPGRGAYEVYPSPVRPTCRRVDDGEWNIPPYNSGIVGVHAALLHTRKVLFFTYRDPGPDSPPGPATNGDSAVLDIATGTITRPRIGTGEMNLFCSGHAFLADGRLLIAGGERQTARNVFSLHTFSAGEAEGGVWRNLGELPEGRWYPTCTTLPDGRVIIVGGDAWTSTYKRTNPTFEIYDPELGLQPPRPAPFIEEDGFSTYPFVVALPSGKVLIHIGTRTRFLNLSTLAFDPLVLEAVSRPDRNARTYNLEGTCVLLPLVPESDPPYRTRVMMFGGGGAQPAIIRTPATNTCEILDLGETSPRWRLAAPMRQGRVMPDCVVLPTGKVLVMNGSSTGVADNGANPVFETELYDPQLNTWRSMCPMTVPRLYHATALLLPDGRVMTAGTDSMWNPNPFHESELRVEIFSPPYVFHRPRPSIFSGPTEIRYGQTFEVITSDAASVSTVALLRCGSVTHSFNSDQRYVGLRILWRGPLWRLIVQWTFYRLGRLAAMLGISDRILGPIRRLVPVSGLRLQAPPNEVAPPGYYMLFLNNSSGVPSVAHMIRLH